MTTFIEAIAREEGWLTPKSRCRRNHNPGNIGYGQFAIAHGAIGEDSHHFAIFRTDGDGFLAAQALLSTPKYIGLTVAQAIGDWAPEEEIDTDLYIRNVCAWCGCNPTTPVCDLLSLPTASALAA